jgi:hypothetical protein
MLDGMFSSCSSAMCLRTISEYRKRSPQMRQCHWSRTKMYGRHSELFGSSLDGAFANQPDERRSADGAPQCVGTKRRGTEGSW